MSPRSDEAQEKMDALMDRAKLLMHARQGDITPDLIRSYPGYAWIKRWESTDRTYSMVHLSERYVDELLGPRFLDYIGRTDFDIWPQETAAVFYQNDERVRRADEAIIVEEAFVSPLTGKHGKFEGVKWAFTSGGSLYLAGMGKGTVLNAAIASQ